MRALKAVLKFFGSGFRAGFALIGIFVISGAIANYNMTVPGSGTPFGSIVVATVHYAQMLVCDSVTPANCAKVQAGNSAVNTDVALTVADPTLAAIAIAPVPCKAGTAPSTQTAVGSGATTAEQCDLNGNKYNSPQQIAGILAAKGGAPVVNGGSFYQAVAASQTAAVLQSSAGATGDYLSHCVIYPTSTSPGAVTVFDNTNTAANSAILFPGGASSISNLVPFAVPAGTVSKNGAWEVTTGANVSVVCYGKFS